MADQQETVDRQWQQPLGPPVAPGKASSPPFVAMTDPQAAVSPDEEFVPLRTFPDEWKKTFEGLVYLGYLTEEVRIPGHRFVIRTIYPAEELEVAQICAPYENTMGFTKAYRAAVVAASLVHVDGQQIILASQQEGSVWQRYQYVISSWFTPVINLLFSRVNKLQGDQLEVMFQLGVLERPKE